MSSSVASVSASAADVMTGSINTCSSEARILLYVFEVNLEIKEDDGKVSWQYLYSETYFYELFLGILFSCGKGQKWF